MREVIDVEKLDPDFKYEIAKEPGGEMIMRCFACGTCSAGCPVREIDDGYNPRKIIRMALLGMKDKVLESDFIWQCAHCYQCHQRCPQDVRFTDIIGAMRSLAIKDAKKKGKRIKAPGYVFARSFMTCTELFGKVWEPALLPLFFLGTANLKGLIDYMPLGMKFFPKGKIRVIPPVPLVGTSSKVRNIKKRAEEANK
ncbi:MAG: 4Fe-4S dicluster domain-containing protein [Candidatus Eremiobacteraeota bacterium]|nr:4Fe-4S dicluster domain-containing protein [Candidatus Eremiobacteraeota bacterium]